MRPFAVTRGPRSWPPKSGEGSNLTLVTNERMGGNMRKALMIIGLVGAVSILGASSGMAANAVAVTTAAAIDGTYGLEVTVDGASVNVAFVQDDSPAGETVYRVQFWLDRNLPTIANRDAFNIYKGLQEAGNKKNLLVKLKRGKDGLFYIYSFCQDDAGGWVLAHKGMQFKDKPTGVMLEWQAASAPGANDGFLRMYKVTLSGGAVLKAWKEGIDNDTRVVDSARLGLTSIPPAGTATLYMDSYESYRTLAP